MKYFYFISLVCIVIICIFIQKVESGPYIVVDRGFCNETYTVRFNTECQHCDINAFTDCPYGSVKQTSKEGVSGCEYIQNLGPGYNETKTGCYHTCSEQKQNVRCCRGYWGQQCQECPGGATNVCNGHGDCDDTVNGTGLCTCEAGYSGYACELCLNSTDPSQNCSNVLPATAACQNTTCPENTVCVVIDDDPVCTCQWPYVDQEGSDNSTINCTKVDMCQVPPLCHANASCSTIHEPKVVKNCSCLPGYHGDGYVCDPVNPCQVDNGGCPEQSTTCVMDAPGQSHCECLYGYTEFVPNHGCHLIDLCVNNGSQCHPKAVCETTAPFMMECKCAAGYTGNGKICYGNILQTIQNLDNDDPTLKGQLSLIQSAIEKYYSDELTQDGPFTVFVPTNGGFRTTNTANFEKWLDDGVRVRQVLRQHMLVGEFHTENLLNQSIFYTLQGVGAQLQVGRGNILKFNLHGDRKATLLKKNIVATNGMIHIVNRLMTNPSPATGDEKLSVMEVIAKNGQFNRLEMLIKAAGPELQTLLQKDNITVFLPINGAFDSLPDSAAAMEFLQSDEGLEKLKVILKSHIVDKKIEVAELIQKFAVTVVTNVRIAVKVQENGAVILNRKVQITQSDIEARNGMLYTVDSVLLPAGVSTLPNKCDNYTYKLVKGVCSDCSNEHSCSNEDVYMNETASCIYYVPGLARRHPFRFRNGPFQHPANDIVGYFPRRPFPPMVRRTGCAALCNRTYITSECCLGFYGYDCLPCPGGYQNPCNGHGKCDDHITGSGVCTCEENFAGTACERCSRDNYFGPNCSEECTCIHGTCNAGPQGNGLCNTNRGCKGLYMGDNCQKKSVPCSTATSRDYCHAHAQCIMVDPQSNVYSCLCKPGYRGDGEDCVEINPCTEPHRGGCHIQATCTKISPGQSQCTCSKGWVGDGLYCYPSSPCSNHSDCHSNAACLETTPGDHICKCMPGYHGDGKTCVLTDLCTVDNGNCHPKAVCNAVGPGQVNCTCPIDQGYIGDGHYRCYGNLIKEIQDHPNLTMIADLLNRLDPDDRELFLDDDYTVFLPLDFAVAAFTFQTSKVYWQKADNIITLLNYHTIQNKSSIIRWLALSSVYGKIDTMADGFSLHIFTEGKIGYVSPRKGSSVKARILEADIPATNGYMNIIDQVLEPYYPNPPDSNPDLETFFNNNPNCSIFGKWLKDKNLIDRLENDLNQYTLFIPSDAYASKVNVTVTTDFLRYYIVPSMLLTASADDGVTVPTDLGADHQLVYNVHGWKNVSINNVPISTPDIFTLGGTVNIIDGLLHPVLHMCNVTKKAVEFGICHECGASYLCPEGYTKYKGSSELKDCYYNVRKWFVDTVEKGCQGLCVTDQVTTGCCSGYFGPTCQECPGGPETPCHDNGHCSDGLQGNGQCVCTGPFTGLECDKCIHGWTGPKCDIDMYGCEYRNGGCHKAAVCHRDDNGKISCKCGPGYRGDGFNCTGPCEINNGGCHRNANCFYKAAVGVTCSCKPNYLGDGKEMCNGDIYSTLLTLEDSSQFVKSISMAFDGNSTLHLLQRLGNSPVMVFVPVDTSLNDRILNNDELNHHIVLTNKSVKLDNSVSNITLKTLAGNNLIIKYDSQADMFLVNNTKVIKANIRCTNGMINLISAPLTNPPMRSQNQKSATPIVAIVIPVVCVVVVAAIVIIAVVIYRKTKFGYWQLFHKWAPKQDTEGDTTSQARLSFNDPDNNSGAAGNTNFGNPLYKMNDDDL